MPTQVVVCYIPALDRRWVNETNTPFVRTLLETYPAPEFLTQPYCDPAPTIFTGVDPEVHEIWQVAFKQDVATTPVDRLLDVLPDSLMTTWQCVRYAFNKKHDLPAMSRWRRRRIELKRLRYGHRAVTPHIVDTIGGVPSLTGLLGDRGRYVGLSTFEGIPAVLKGLPDERLTIDFIEFHALDHFVHWNMDQPDELKDRLRVTDQFLADAHEACRERGVLFVLLVDHGQEPIEGTINFEKLMRRAGVPRGEFCYFTAKTDIRLWFGTDRARRRITEVLEQTPHIRLVLPEELHQFGIRMNPERFGHLYVGAENNRIFYPHDFHNPLGNIFMGLTEPTMRRRILNPIHKATHGRWPELPGERGYVVVADDRYVPTKPKMRMADFAPSVLHMIGRDVPDYMTGEVSYARKAEFEEALGAAS